MLMAQLQQQTQGGMPELFCTVFGVHSSISRTSCNISVISMVTIINSNIVQADFSDLTNTSKSTCELLKKTSDSGRRRDAYTSTAENSPSPHQQTVSSTSDHFNLCADGEIIPETEQYQNGDGLLCLTRVCKSILMGDQHHVDLMLPIKREGIKGEKQTSASSVCSSTCTQN